MNADHKLLGTDLDKTAGAAKPRVMKSPYEGPTHRKAGGPPPGLVAQTAATKVYRCTKPGCKASVRLDATAPLPEGWSVYSGDLTDSPAYRCPDHRVLTNNDYRRAARRLHEREGVVEIEEFAHIEDADGDRPGVWVEAWVWVSDEDARAEDARAQGEN